MGSVIAPMNPLILQALRDAILAVSSGNRRLPMGTRAPPRASHARASTPNAALAFVLSRVVEADAHAESQP